jgi:alanine racemase
MNENINYASINLNNLRSNYNTITKLITPPAGVICVVKADAYGHGMKHCADTLYNEGARWFAVATLSEAMDLRRILPDAEILIMGYTPCQHADMLAENNIVQTVYSTEYAITLNNNASKTIRAHVKVDTGMNRLGFTTPDELPKLPYLNYEGVFTHFACADEPDNPMTMNQYRQFINFIDNSGIDFQMRHAANSGAILNYPNTHLDMVRAGIILYTLNPVLTLVSSISHIHTVKKGETVGYGATFTAQRDMKIITVSLGYADGFIRAYNKGVVTVNGKGLPVIGRICMDQFMADATDVTDIKIGDRVYIFGDNALMKADDYADIADTINYEVVCTISKRVPRIVI